MALDSVMITELRMLGSTSGSVMDFRIWGLVAPQISPISSSSLLMLRSAEETLM